MFCKRLTVLALAAALGSPALAQQIDRCDDVRFSLTGNECIAYGGTIDTDAGTCGLSAGELEVAQEEICLGLPTSSGEVTNFAPAAGLLLALVGAAGLAGGGSTSTTTTTGGSGG